MASYYPPVGFHFKVEVTGVSTTDSDQRFQEVGGLSSEVETEELREGGENRFSYKLPKRIRYPNLVLKRGMLNDSGLIGWLKDALEDFDFKPADILITLLNENHEPLASWNVKQAYPVKWQISDLRAMDNSLVVETIELAYQQFTRV